MGQILNEADYMKDKEVLFHQQCERMNSAARWWPILQVSDYSCRLSSSPFASLVDFSLAQDADSHHCVWWSLTAICFRASLWNADKSMHRSMTHTQVAILLITGVLQVNNLKRFFKARRLV